MKTFHSIAHYAQSEGTGHFYHYHLALQRAIEKEGVVFSAYVPLSASFAEMPKGWKTWFHPFFNRKNRRKFWKDCKRLFKDESAQSRIFFLEFFGRRDFKLFALAAFLFLKKNDSFWVLYRDDLTTRRKKDQYTIRFFSKLLAWKYKKRFVTLTDSELLANYYESWFQKRPIVLPIPHTEYVPFERREKKQKLVLSWPGNPRPEKGAKEIAQLVQIPDPRSSEIELDVSGATFLPPFKNKVQLHLRKALLTEEEYYEALHRSDIILLPYDPEKYKWRTSGPFVEAILAGKLPLVKEGSWLAYELKRFNLKELIVDWNNSHFFSNAFTILENQAVTEKFRTMQEAYRRMHSVESLRETLKPHLSH